MSLKLEIGWIVTNIETIYVNDVLCCVGCIDCCKILSTIWEFDLLTLLELPNLSVMFDLIIVNTHIHQSQPICETNYNVETWWMNTYTVSFFIEKTVCLHTLLLIIPYSDVLVCTTCHNEWFTHTNIHSIYWVSARIDWWAGVEWQWDQFKISLFFKELFGFEFQTVNQIARECDNDCVLTNWGETDSLDLALDVWDWFDMQYLHILIFSVVDVNCGVVTTNSESLLHCLNHLNQEGLLVHMVWVLEIPNILSILITQEHLSQLCANN